MQNRYVGDVGDFGKYGLLRRLSGIGSEPRLKLGVIWYLVPDESHNADGKHVVYLLQSKLRHCDPQLFDMLGSALADRSGCLKQEARAVSTIESSGILPAETLFYSCPLAYSPGMQRPDRVAVRLQWFSGALDATRSADLVFLDPDNGIECKTSRTSKRGPKYAYWDDIMAFAARGQSVVLYHHLFREETSLQIGRIRNTFEELTGLSTSALVFTKGTRRAYFVAAQPGHRAVLETLI